MKAAAIVIVLLLAGCTTAPPPQAGVSPCAVHEASWECQIERYDKVSTP